MCTIAVKMAAEGDAGPKDLSVWPGESRDWLGGGPTQSEKS